MGFLLVDHFSLKIKKFITVLKKFLMGLPYLVDLKGSFTGK